MKTCDLVVVTAVIVFGFSAAQAQDVSFGQRLFRDKAECQILLASMATGVAIHVRPAGRPICTRRALQHFPLNLNRGE
jgi:hypothetical protein